MKKNNYIPTISSLYINYVFQGIAAIIVTQNKSVLLNQWGASLSQLSLVISAVGLGRILSLNFAGYISDKLGRRLTAILGALSYVIFFFGLLYSPNYIVAFIISIFAGFGNAFLDTSSYPTVVEAFADSKNNSALSVMNKAFISIGQFIFPIITRFISQNNIYFGVTFIVSAVCLALNIFLMLKLPFPKANQRGSVEQEQEKQSETSLPATELMQRTNFKLEGTALLIFSFVSVSLFNVFITWIPSYAEVALKIAEKDSLVFVSYYSIFSFISVFITSFIVSKGINIPKFMMACTAITGTALFIMLMLPSLLTILLATFCVGFFAAGGIWQLGLALMLEFFPFKRGVTTSYYSLATSFSVMGIPYITGLLAEKSMTSVFALVVVLAFIGVIALIVVNKRYKEVFG